MKMASTEGKCHDSVTRGSDRVRVGQTVSSSRLTQLVHPSNYSWSTCRVPGSVPGAGDLELN